MWFRRSRTAGFVALAWLLGAGPSAHAAEEAPTPPAAETPAAAADPAAKQPAAEKRLQVVISRSHHQVLPHWLRAAREGILPASGVQVLHLDAHPDLAVPEGAVAPNNRNPTALMRSVDIASFQLAAVRVGLVERVVWLRPSYADQLPDGPRSYQVGRIGSGQLRVDDPSDYYVLDEGWAASDALLDPVRVQVEVVPLEQAASRTGLAEGAIVLDIDLDAFATRNPAAERLRHYGLRDEDLDRLRTMFAPSRLALAEDPAERIAQLEAIMGAIDNLASGNWGRAPASIWTLWQRGLGPSELYRLYGILGSVSDERALEFLLEDGRELVGLPEHTQVDAAEIEARADLLAGLLRQQSIRPAIVTIARSVQDGYTPEQWWPLIEWTVLDRLKQTLGDFEIRYDRGLDPAPSPQGG